jgi:hypothetical protein
MPERRKTGEQGFPGGVRKGLDAHNGLLPAPPPSIRLKKMGKNDFAA